MRFTCQAETVPTEQGEMGVRHIWSALETGKSGWTSQKEKKSKLSFNARQTVHVVWAWKQPVHFCI